MANSNEASKWKLGSAMAIAGAGIILVTGLSNQKMSLTSTLIPTMLMLVLAAFMFRRSFAKR
jgi:hypothetical protein